MATSAARTTLRRRSGDAAEALVARELVRAGWTILGRNVAVGSDELDLVAVDPGPPRMLVFVEVRSTASGRFGRPEESLAGPKLGRTYRAAFALMRTGHLPDGAAMPSVPWRVDVVLVEQRPALGAGLGGPVVRHLRAVGP